MLWYKRILASVLVFVLLITSFSVTVFAETAGEYEYAVNEDGTVTITLYTGSAADVTIPSQIDGKTVTVIGEYAFNGYDFIKSVTLPDTLKEIQTCAFEACTSLKSIAFPDSLEKIGELAFFNCMALSTIESTPYLYDIGYQAFHNTSWMMRAEKGFLYVGRVLYRYIGLTELNAVIDVPDYTAAIAPGAFEGQYNISEIRLPVGLRTIGTFAFVNCYRLIDVRIPPSVTSIGDYIFLDNTVTTITGASNCTARNYASENDITYRYDTTLDYLDGDLDKDGEISSSDIRILMKAVLMSEECDHDRFLSCDIIYDGEIKTNDIREWMMISIA